MGVRQMTAADCAAFLHVRSEGLNNDPDSFRVTAQDDQALGEAYWAARLGTDVVVGYDRRGDLLGIGGLQRASGEKLEHKALIWGMYVQPNARGSGVADALIEALIERSPIGVRQLQLTVMAHNTRGRRFYERHGFSVYGIEPASVRVADQLLDEALMWRPLA